MRRHNSMTPVCPHHAPHGPLRPLPAGAGAPGKQLFTFLPTVTCNAYKKNTLPCLELFTALWHAGF